MLRGRGHLRVSGSGTKTPEVLDTQSLVWAKGGAGAQPKGAATGDSQDRLFVTIRTPDGSSAEYQFDCGASSCVLTSGGRFYEWDPTDFTWDRWHLKVYEIEPTKPPEPPWPALGATVEAGGIDCTLARVDGRCSAHCKALAKELAMEEDPNPTFDLLWLWHYRWAPLPRSEMNEVADYLIGRAKHLPATFDGPAFQILEIHANADDQCDSLAAHQLGSDERSLFEEPEAEMNGGGWRWVGHAGLVRQAGVWRTEDPQVGAFTVSVARVRPYLAGFYHSWGGTVTEYPLGFLRPGGAPPTELLRWYDVISCPEEGGFVAWLQGPNRACVLSKDAPRAAGSNPRGLVPSDLMDLAFLELRAGHVERSHALYTEWLETERAHPELVSSHPYYDPYAAEHPDAAHCDGPSDTDKAAWVWHKRDMGDWDAIDDRFGGFTDPEVQARGMRPPDSRDWKASWDGLYRGLESGTLVLQRPQVDQDLVDDLGRWRSPAGE